MAPRMVYNKSNNNVVVVVVVVVMMKMMLMRILFPMLSVASLSSSSVQCVCVCIVIFKTITFVLVGSNFRKVWRQTDYSDAFESIWGIIPLPSGFLTSTL
jgi:hypothetical protein